MEHPSLIKADETDLCFWGRVESGRWASRGTPASAALESKYILLAVTGSGEFVQWRTLQVPSDQTLGRVDHLALFPESV